MDGHEAWAKALYARKVLVATGLINAPLPTKFRFERLNGHAIGRCAAIAASFANGGVDESPLLWIRHRASLA